MAYQQVAKLYLRGSLCNKILKDLTPDQREEIEQIVMMVMEDPLLRQCRAEFCNALARTIRNDYEVREAAEQDYMIAIMRGAVAAKFGYGKNPPSEEAISDPEQRKKWFQTWAFNYLRQILRENKLPRQSKSERYTVPADTAALHYVGETITNSISSERDFRHKRILRNLYNQAELVELHDGHLIRFDHWLFPIELVHGLCELGEEYLSHGIGISQTRDGIKITCSRESLPSVTIVKKTEQLVRMVSFDGANSDQQEHQRDRLEAASIVPPAPGGHQMEQVVEDEVITKLRDRLPEDAKPVFDIYREETRPEDYIQRFGESRPKVAHVATYLGKSPREIKRLLSIIKMQCLALNVGQ